MKFSLIVLSKTIDYSIYNMNCNCFESFIQSAKKAKVDFEILLIESNPNVTYSYDSVKILNTDLDFNFHKFLNIGIKHSKGDYYILSNNDVIFDKKWLIELLVIVQEQPKFKSFSPYDKYSNKLPKQLIENNNYIKGYEIQKHVAGWCIIAHYSVFHKLKKLDETFDFYYADFDYALSLRKYNINHALITKAEVRHIENKQNKEGNQKIDFKKNEKKIPKYVIKENWFWVLQDNKMIDGIIKYHNKWGSRQSLKIKLIITGQLTRIGLGYFNRFIL